MLNNTLTLNPDDARTLEMLGYIQSIKQSQAAYDNKINRSNERDTKETTARSPTDTRVSRPDKTAMRLAGMGLSMAGVPYAGTMINGINNLATGNIEGLKNQGINLATNTILTGINPVLGLLGGQLSLGEVASVMAKYDTSLPEAFAASNPTLSKMLDINQPDPEKNKAALDKAMKLGTELGFTGFDAAMAGFASLAGGEVDKNESDSGSRVDRSSDPSTNTSSMSDKDI